MLYLSMYSEGFLLEGEKKKKKEKLGTAML